MSRCGNNCGGCKDNKCERLQKCAEEMAARNAALLECINKKLREIACLEEEAAKLRAQAHVLDEQVEVRTKEVRCLLKKLQEMLAKTNAVYDKAVECFKEEAEDDCNFDDCWCK